MSIEPTPGICGVLRCRTPCEEGCSVRKKAHGQNPGGSRRRGQMDLRQARPRRYNWLLCSGVSGAPRHGCRSHASGCSKDGNRALQGFAPARRASGSGALRFTGFLTRSGQAAPSNTQRGGLASLPASREPSRPFPGQRWAGGALVPATGGRGQGLSDRNTRNRRAVQAAWTSDRIRTRQQWSQRQTRPGTGASTGVNLNLAGRGLQVG